MFFIEISTLNREHSVRVEFDPLSFFVNSIIVSEVNLYYSIQAAILQWLT